MPGPIEGVRVDEMGLWIAGPSCSGILHANFPHLIYAAVSGYGHEGDESDRAAYDVGAWYCRAGIVDAHTHGDSELPLTPRRYGRLPTGLGPQPHRPSRHRRHSHASVGPTKSADQWLQVRRRKVVVDAGHGGTPSLAQCGERSRSAALARQSKSCRHRAHSCCTKAPTSNGDMSDMIASPVDFSGMPWSVESPTPELGLDTEIVLLEMGKTWDDIERLKGTGVIP